MAQPDGDGRIEIELEEHLSQQFICPISHRIMDVPMITPCGHTYDRDSISAWLERRSVDPLSLQPLRLFSLYPNRALQEELLEQLQRLSASGDSHLAAAAKAKLDEVSRAKTERSGQAETDSQLAKLDQILGRLVSLSVWLGRLAWEQALMLPTSYGALLCLSVDATQYLRSLVRPSLSANKEVRVPLLKTFMHLAAWPGKDPPHHWSSGGRLTIASLRCALLLPVGSMTLVIVMGGFLSCVRFVQRCIEVRTFEVERMLRNSWYMYTMLFFKCVVGYASVGLFMHLYRDHRQPYTARLNLL
jgi:hypothetical protein